MQQSELDYERECVILTQLGLLKGVTIFDKSGRPLCHRFMNVKYAQPPTGARRWQKPEVLDESFDYSKQNYVTKGKICPQPSLENTPLSFLNEGEETSEDCLYVNIWIPGEISPEKFQLSSYPVLFYIHGGWLQYGSANHSADADPRSLLSSGRFPNKFIIVAPSYRLNLLGFLTFSDSKNNKNFNFGFWDQRAALEWTYKYIYNFGGDKERITVGGLSAGSYSTFYQVAYEVYNPQETQIIKQVFHVSNCVLIQPKTVSEGLSQFGELCSLLGLGDNLSSEEKVDALRLVDSAKLEEAILSMKVHTFRPVTDDIFIKSHMIEDIVNGTYATLLRNKGIRIVMGEVDSEPWMYSVLNTPNSLNSFQIELTNYYTEAVAKELLSIYEVEKFFSGNPSLINIRILYGQILSDGQVYASSRGFLHKLATSGTFNPDNIFRYRVAFVPSTAIKEFSGRRISGAVHGSDTAIWFYAAHLGFNKAEKEAIATFVKPFTDFILMRVDNIEWGNNSPKCIRLLNLSGETQIVEDDKWDEYIDIANRVYKRLLQFNIGFKPIY